MRAIIFNLQPHYRYDNIQVVHLAGNGKTRCGRILKNYTESDSENISCKVCQRFVDGDHDRIVNRLFTKYE